MTVTGTWTVREICTRALRKVGAVAVGQSAQAEDMAEAQDALFAMLKAWQVEDALWTRDTMSVAVVADTASYALASPARPLRIHSVRYKSASGTETPMEQLNRREYDELPIKDTTGIPTTFFYDRAREQGTLYVWPLKASVTTETLEITYEAEIEDPDTLGDVIDAPAEWYEAIVYGLAVRLMEEYEFENPRMEARAAAALMTARAAANTESVFF